MPSTWLYAITTPYREQLVKYLREHQIDARAIWTALPDLPVYANSVRGSYPVARQIACEALLLPTSSTMNAQAAIRVAEAVQGFFNE
jgi:perosamine synthetase